MKNIISQAKERKAEAEREEAKRQEEHRLAEAERHQRLVDARIRAAMASDTARKKAIIYVFASMPAAAGIVLAIIALGAGLGAGIGCIPVVIGIVLSVLVIFLPILSVITGALAVLIGVWTMFGKFTDDGMIWGYFLFVIPGIYCLVVSLFSRVSKKW
jgi:uncharacterized membrane protein YdbT with pleckstrin-like domain